MHEHELEINRKQTEINLKAKNEQIEEQNKEKEKRAAELTRSKQLLDETGKLARVGGWEFSLKNNELSWSEVIYWIYEVEPDYQPTIESAINFYAPESILVISEAVRQAIEEGKSFDVDLQLITAKQNSIWVRAIGQAFRDNGEIVKIGGAFQDINDRILTEHKLIHANKELVFQNEEKEKRAAELIIANKELVFQNREKEKRADELIMANKELAFQNEEKGKRATELIIANKELVFQNREKEKRAAELIIANKELVFQNREKEKRADELIMANKKLEFQNVEKEKRATELIIAGKELSFLNIENRFLDSSLDKKIQILHLEDSLKDSELIRSLIESGSIRHEYFLADNKEDFINILETKNFDIILSDFNLPDYNGNEALKVVREKYFHIPFIFVSGVMGEDIAIDAMLNGATDYVLKNKLKRLVPAIKRAIHEHELEIIRKQTTINLKEKNEQIEVQNEEKEKRADELIMANKELAFQNDEKEKRAAELIIATKELDIQNKEKEKRAAELIIANKELVFQNREKEKRADELIIANKELIFQNEEKEKQADELIMANKELAFQNEEKKIRAAELIIVNKELAFQVEVNKVLEQFTYVVSHNLQEPLRTVSNYIQVLEEDYSEILDDTAIKYLHLVDNSTKRMSTLLNTLADISRLGRNIKLTNVDCKKIIDEVIADLQTLIKTSNAIIEVKEMPVLNVYEIEMRQLFQNLITNAIKFQKKYIQPKIQIRSEKINENWKFSVSDNGIGIAPVHFERIFDIFQRLHTDAEYEGNGIGLSNCKKIVQLHYGEIWIESEVGKGSTFYFTIPNLTI